MTGSKNNPSLGLGLWGPLVPASDCKPCVASLALIQAFAGSYLIRRPGRRVFVCSNRWANRLVKLGGALSGTYLTFTAAIELVRLAMPYDPWVADARRARQQSIDTLYPQLKTENPIRKYGSPANWKFWWFGPPNYEAVPRAEWGRRAVEHFERAEAARVGLEGMYSMHEKLRAENMAIANEVQRRISTGELKVPDAPQLVRIEWSVDGDAVSAEEIFDSIDLRELNMWELFEEPRSFSLSIIPRFSPVFSPDFQPKFGKRNTVQSVNYAPFPQLLKRF